MRHFDKIVMAEKEPIMKMGTLWLRPKRTVAYDTDSNEVMKDSWSINYYGDNGWESILDFDTKYTISSQSFDSPSDNPIVPDSIPESEYDGSVGWMMNMYLYKGNRPIGENMNLVTEQGLKVEIDTLNSRINELDSKIDNILEMMQEMSNTITSLGNTVTTLGNRISSLESRVSAIENPPI